MGRGRGGKERSELKGEGQEAFVRSEGVVEATETSWAPPRDLKGGATGPQSETARARNDAVPTTTSVRARAWGSAAFVWGYSAPVGAAHSLGTRAMFGTHEVDANG